MRQYKFRFLFVVSVVGCIDLGAPIDSIPSLGSIQVPVTIEKETGFRSLDGMIEINKKFKPSDVEKAIFDVKGDLPSQARLLGEFKCFGTWRTQHDFYLKVVKSNHCAYLRHRAVELLEHDMCNEATVTILIDEYKRSVYPQTQEVILRKIGSSRDKRALALIDEALKSKSKILSKAAVDGKVMATQQPCVAHSAKDKPLYGLQPEIAGVCEGDAVSGGDANGYNPVSVSE